MLIFWVGAKTATPCESTTFLLPLYPRFLAQKGLPLANQKYHQNPHPLARTALAILPKIYLGS